MRSVMERNNHMRKSARRLAVRVLIAVGAAGVAIAPVRAGEKDDAWRAAIAAYEAQDFDQAQGHLKRLADSSDPRAQSLLGVMALRGEGTDKEPAAALVWFFKAASGGLPQAQLALATLMEAGIAGDTDVRAAYFWAELAERRGAGEVQQQAMDLSSRLRTNLDEAEITALDREILAWQPDR